MKITIVVLLLGVLIFSSHLFSRLFEKTKIPNVLILMIIGIFAGLFIDKKLFFGEVGQVFTTITLVIILFESGVGLKFSELKSAIGSAVVITFLNFIVTALLIIGILQLFTDLDFTCSLFLGAILGCTSAAVVIPIIKQLKLGKKSGTILLLESALSDVLGLVVGLAAFDSMKAGQLEPSEIALNMLESFVFAALIGSVGGMIWSLILDKVRGMGNSMFTNFAIVFIIYGGVELLKFNGGIAALAFGVILGNSESFAKSKIWNRFFKFKIASLNANEKDFFAEIVFVLQTYFFVYVGVMMEFGEISTYLIALLIIVVILLFRAPIIRLFAKKDCTKVETGIMSVMVPKGLVPAILASMPLQAALPNGGTIAEIAFAVVLLSIVACSLMIIVVSKESFSLSKLFRRKKSAAAATNPAPTDDEIAANVVTNEPAVAAQVVDIQDVNAVDESHQTTHEHDKA